MTNINEKYLSPEAQEVAETHLRRSLHFDARGSRDDVLKNLEMLAQSLDNVEHSQEQISLCQSTLSIRPPAQPVQSMKLQELTGSDNPEYTIAEFANIYDSRDSIVVLQNILPLLVRLGITGKISKNGGKITIPKVDEIYFDERGIITQSNYPAIINKDVFHYIACFIGQDIAVVLKKGDEFRYMADISTFEKTPKNEEGRNSYLWQRHC